jgi:hypothetical protein
MGIMKMGIKKSTLAVLLGSLLPLATAMRVQAQAEDSTWIQLFNGKDLDDWDIKFTGKALNENHNNTFKVVDGVLSVDYSGWSTWGNAFGHIGYKVRAFSHYILRVEYQVGSRQAPGGPGWAFQNNGLMLHSQSAASMTRNQDFPISMEIQLLGSGNTGADNNSTLNLCTPGTGFHTQQNGGSVNTAHCFSAATNTRPAPSTTTWSWATVSVMGDSIVRNYNGPSATGTPTLTFYRPVYLSGGVSSPPANVPSNNTKLDSGYILLQAESHEYRFRKVELLNLVGCMDRNSPAYRSYFVKHNAAACNTVSAAPAPAPEGKPDAYRYRIGKQGLLVEGPGAFQVQVRSPDGTLVSEHRGEGMVTVPTRRAGISLLRITGSRGTQSATVVLP